jgi:type III pantothenate kinase
MRGRLLVDVGNTRTKLALSTPSGPQIVDSWLTADAPRIPTGCNSARIVSVARAARAGLVAALQAAGCTQCFFLGEHLTPAISIDYQTLGTLGMDRVAAASSAWQQSQGPVLVLSAGTALTLDAVSREGRFLGGLIAPGRGALQHGLSALAPSLPAPAAASGFPANSSPSCVGLGLEVAFAGLVREAVQRARQALPEATLWVTGGDADAVLRSLPGDGRVDPLLVLRGLELANEA